MQRADEKDKCYQEAMSLRLHLFGLGKIFASYGGGVDGEHWELEIEGWLGVSEIMCGLAMRLETLADEIASIEALNARLRLEVGNIAPQGVSDEQKNG